MPPDRTVIFAAVSSEEQVGPDLPSLDDQVQVCLRHCLETGDTIVDTIKAEGQSRLYHDLDELRRDSPDYDKLMRYMETGECTRVVFWKWDRLTRSHVLITRVGQIADEHGVWLYPTQEPTARGTSMMAAIVRTLFGLMAEKAVVDMVDNRRKGLRGRAKRGLVVSHIAPFGYRMEGERKERQLLIAEEDRAAVVAIMEMRAEGMGYSRIYKRLHARGIARTDGQDWNTAIIRYICHNPVYAGYVRFREWPRPVKARKRGQPEVTIAKGTHEAIISEELWQAVQRVNESQARDYQHRGKHQIHFYAGIAKCGHCGDGMAYCNGPYGGLVRCARYTRYGGPRGPERPKSCVPNTIRYDELKRQTVAFLRTILEDPDSWAEQQRELTQHNDHADKIAKAEREIAGLQQRLDNLLDAIETTVNADARRRFVERLDALTERRDKAREDLVKLQEADQWIEATRQQLIGYGEAIEDLEDWTDEQLRPLLIHLLDKIIVKKGEPTQFVLKGQAP